MALIQEIATPLFQQIISWANLLLVILIIYKLIRVIMSIAGGDFKFPGLGGSKNKDRKNKKPEEPEDDKKDIKKNKDNYKKIGMDPDNPGKVLFCATDTNENPLIGVKIYVWPLKRNLWTRISRKEYRNKKLGETGPHGFLPDPHYLPAGEWIVKAIKPFWTPKKIFSKNRKRGNRGKLKNKKNIYVYPDKEEDFDKKKDQVRYIIMKRSIEYGSAPLILNANQTRKKGKNYVKLDGIIH